MCSCSSCKFKEENKIQVIDVSEHEEVLEAIVRRRCGELGVCESVTPLVIKELKRMQGTDCVSKVSISLDEAKRVSSHRAGGEGHKKKQQDIKKTQDAERFASAQRQHAKAASKRLDSEIGKLNNFLLDLIRQYQDKKLSFRRLSTKASIAFKGTVEQAFKLGTKAVGLVKPTGALYDLTANEKKWVESYVKEETKYFKRFLDDVRDEISKKQIERRVGLYAGAVRSVYESGRILSVGKNVIITWVLDKDTSRSCPDCLELHRNNPYTVKVLPTTPKAGASQCGSNCRCTLRVEKSDPETVKRIEKKHISASSLIKKLRGMKKKS